MQKKEKETLVVRGGNGGDLRLFSGMSFIRSATHVLRSVSSSMRVFSKISSRPFWRLYLFHHQDDHGFYHCKRFKHYPWLSPWTQWCCQCCQDHDSVDIGMTRHFLRNLHTSVGTTIYSSSLGWVGVWAFLCYLTMNSTFSPFLSGF